MGTRRSASSRSARRRQIFEGAFDITFQALHGLWKFDEDLEPQPPAESRHQARLKLVDYQRHQLDPAKHTVRSRSEHKIGLGGIAKGYVVDRAAAF